MPFEYCEFSLHGSVGMIQLCRSFELIVFIAAFGLERSIFVIFAAGSLQLAVFEHKFMLLLLVLVILGNRAVNKAFIEGALGQQCSRGIVFIRRARAADRFPDGR